jgi:hypothetical protein
VGAGFVLADMVLEKKRAMYLYRRLTAGEHASALDSSVFVNSAAPYLNLGIYCSVYSPASHSSVAHKSTSVDHDMCIGFGINCPSIPNHSSVAREGASIDLDICRIRMDCPAICIAIGSVGIKGRIMDD